MNTSGSQPWFAIGTLCIILLCFVSYLFFTLQGKRTQAAIEREKLELQRRELEIQEQQLEASKAAIELQEEKQVEDAAAAQLRLQSDIEARQAEKAAQAKKEAEINQCIIEAQAERERRKSNVRMVWLACTQDPLFTADECEKYRDYSEIDQMYLGWEANCKRGIDNGF